MYKRIITKFILISVLFAGCKTVDIPDAYNFRPREVSPNPFGCWMELSVLPSPEATDTLLLTGEILFLDHDSVFLLVDDGYVRVVESSNIIQAKLFSHLNQGKNYLAITGVLLIPNILGTFIYISEYAAGFLALGIPVAIMGSIQWLKEVTYQKNVLRYPQKNSLEEMSMFARYPGGMPEGIDYKRLYLGRR